MDFISRGIGGGGALFGPAISPHDPNLMFVVCDMSPVFRSDNGGYTWQIVNWKMLQARPSTQVQFSSAANILYACSIQRQEPDAVDGDANSIGQVKVSTDYGETWVPFSNWSAIPGYDASNPAVAAVGDVTRPDHLIFTDSKKLYSLTWNAALDLAPFINTYDFPGGSARISGSYFFINSDVLVATHRQLLFAAGAEGQSFVAKNMIFAASPGTPWPAPNEYIISFAAGRDALSGQVRLYAVTVNISGFPGVTVADVVTAVPGTLKVYPTQLYWATWPAAGVIGWNALDLPPTNPNQTSKLPRPQHVAMTADSDVAHVATTHIAGSPFLISAVYRVASDQSISEVFKLDFDNTTISTGWVGSSKNTVGVLSPASPGIYVPRYQPDNGQEGFVNFSSPTGLAVAFGGGAEIVLVTDTASIHKIDDASQQTAVAKQVYLYPDDSNPPGARIPAGKYYRSNWLETTVCTWIDWLTPSELRTSCNDIASTTSKDGGTTWSFGQEHWEVPRSYQDGDEFPGDIYQTAHYNDDDGSIIEFAIRYHLGPEVNTPFSSVDALIGSKVNSWTGALHMLVRPSTQSSKGGMLSPAPSAVLGANTPRWRSIKENFGSPDPGEFALGGPGGNIIFAGGLPTWMAIDAAKKRLYVAVAHSLGGGVWYCDDEIPKINYNSTWTRILTGPHPHNIYVLSSDRLLISQCGNMSGNNPDDPNNFIDKRTSGVFVLQRYFDQNGKEQWTYNKNPLTFQPITSNTNDLQSWVQSVLPDPTAPHSTWYACVWAVGKRRTTQALTQYGPNFPHGALWRTTDSGKTWSEVWSGKSVTSCTIHPIKREMYICTRFDGLYRCPNIDAFSGEVFAQVDEVSDYPFRAPMRVFYSPPDPDNPEQSYQVWVTSNGNGLSFLVPDHGVPPQSVAPQSVRIGAGLWARISTNNARRGDVAFPGLPAATEEVDAIVERIMREVEADIAEPSAADQLRDLLRQEVQSRLSALATKKT